MKKSVKIYDVFLIIHNFFAKILYDICQRQIIVIKIVKILNKNELDNKV